MTAFYIYAYLRDKTSETAEAETPYYIGKGKDYRAWDKRHHVPVPKNKKFIVILENNLTEIGSFALERQLIRWYGRKDIGTGILLNQSGGGEGSSGSHHSEETKQKMSKSGKGRVSHRKGKNISDLTKEKISKSTKGRKKSEITKERMRESKENIECPYCKKRGGKPAMMRWHFEQCKEKK